MQGTSVNQLIVDSLATEIDRVRADADFTERAKRLLERDKELLERLAWNHPLPDGNKRAAWAALLLFIDFNGGTWDSDPPDVDEAESAMLAVAAGDVDESQRHQT